MNKEEFLAELRRNLNGKMAPADVDANVDYYRAYIDGELMKGRSETEVMEELGPARLIAKTLTNSPDSDESDGGYTYGGQGSYEQNNYSQGSYGRNGYNQGNYDQGQNTNRSSSQKKTKRNSVLSTIIIILVILLCIFLVLSLIRGTFYLVWRFFPIIIIVILVVWFYRAFRR